MVSIDITKGQGLTQALKTYAKAQGYDVSDISKNEWTATVDRLEAIQTQREKANQESIYTKVNADKKYNTMLVHTGKVDFTEAEFQSLLVSMGLETKASAYENWTVAVAKQPAKNQGEFQVKSDSSKDAESYNKDLETMAVDYIKQYDTDEDGNISYAEFEAKEIKQTKENGGTEIDEESLNAAKATLKTTYNHINVDNEGKSKGKLTKSEIMNFIFSMDSTNEKTTADGFVSQTEYISMANALANNGEDGETIFDFLKNNYVAFFKKFN